MDIKELKNKLVAVLGFGLEGRAVTSYLIKHGIKPVLFDARPWEEWSKEEQKYIKSLQINFIFGPGYLEELGGFDVVFRSPGIRVSDVVKALGLPDVGEGLKPSQTTGRVINPSLQNHTPIVTSQTKWFFEHCPCKIIGVTGTKGKGTTATLISEILKLQCQMSNVKCQTYLTGNIGKEQPLDFLDDLKSEDWVVYELSSFQLQDLEQSPHIGVVLMVTQEHLDYHTDVNEYVCAKEPIVKHQTSGDFAVINADFETSMKIGALGNGKKIYFSRKKELKGGCFVKGGQLIVKDVNGLNFQFQISNIQLRGAHNLENICAAVIASVCAGCGVKSIKSAITSFKGLEHRLEFVAEKNGVKFYNDSFSTTPETAIAAIQSFSEPLVAVMGGSSKNSDFSDLAGEIIAAKNIKALILIGQEADRIQKQIEKAGKFAGQIYTEAGSMPQIFDQIRSVARPGDVVLLSPACASFGMFKNYKDRGEQFKNSVRNF